MYKFLNTSLNGNLIKCSHSENFQLSYKNLTFSLTPFELESFKTYLSKIDATYWEKEYENSIYEKKIPISTLQSNLIILIDRYELFELISLMNYKEKKEFLTFNQVNYHINYN
ncbi:DUF6686 family protein [Flavobacterium sp.]|uniref:DUF6686 family protein n=1 Tax=Flavobacterium sp. TaxID=239 RepID=UPI00374FF668